MTTNMQQGAQATNAQPGQGADAPAGGAGGGQQGVVAGVPRFNPSVGVDALGGGGNGAGPGDTGNAQGSPKPTADAGGQGSGQQQPDTKALEQQLAAATAKAAQLQAELDKAIGKRQEAKASTEELSASVNSLTRQLRQRDTVDAVLAGVPQSKAKLAKAVVLGLHNGSMPIDLAGEDQAATVKAVMERLKADYPDLLTEAAPSPTIPKIQGAAVGPNGVSVQRVGVMQDAHGRPLL